MGCRFSACDLGFVRGPVVMLMRTVAEGILFAGGGVWELRGSDGSEGLRVRWGCGGGM